MRSADWFHHLLGAPGAREQLVEDTAKGRQELVVQPDARARHQLVSRPDVGFVTRSMSSQRVEGSVSRNVDRNVEGRHCSRKRQKADADSGSPTRSIHVLELTFRCRISRLQHES